MLKLMGLLKHRRDSNLQAFADHWRTIHRDLALRLIGPGYMRGYIQNHRIPVTIEGADLAADGVPEVWIDGLDALRRLTTSPEYLDGAAVDEPRFIDMSQFASLLLGREAVVDDGPGRQAVVPLVKAILFFHPAPGRTMEEFRCWEAIDHPVLTPEARPVRLSRHTAVDPADDLPPPAYAGVETSWWPDIAGFQRAWARRQRASDIVDAGHVAGLLALEEPVLWPAQDVEPTLPPGRWGLAGG